MHSEPVILCCSRCGRSEVINTVYSKIKVKPVMWHITKVNFINDLYGHII